jgi:hypothetical protein
VGKQERAKKEEEYKRKAKKKRKTQASQEEEDRNETIRKLGQVKNNKQIKERMHFDFYHGKDNLISADPFDLVYTI